MSIALSSVVSVTVSLSAPGITRQGFGTMLLLSNTGNAWATPELTREYTSDSYSDDFASTTAEYAALAAIFGQPSPPDTVLVGKGPTKPTMRKTIDISSVVNSTLYTINVYSTGVLWTASYTSDASATKKEIVDALQLQLTPAAWQALTPYVAGDRVLNDSGKMYQCTTGGTSAAAVGPTGTGATITDATVTWTYVVTPNFTAADDDVTITCTGAAAGNWFAMEPIASGDTSAVSNLMELTDTSADPGIATDLDAILSQNAAWYELALLFKSSAILSTSSTGASAWANANKRLLVASVADTACATDAYSAGSDVLKTLVGQAGSYTAGQWHPRDYEFLDCCTAGYFLPIDPGGDNWRLKSLVGPTPVNLTPTQQTNLDDRRSGYYSTLGGQNVLAGGGYVMSTTYGFIDNRRNIDWYATNLQADLIDLLVQNNKLPNTTAGRRIIASTMANRNDLGIQAGVISPDPLDPTNAQAPIMVPYVVTVPPVTDTDSFTASTRALSGLSTRWKLASPINSMDVTVNVQQ